MILNSLLSHDSLLLFALQRLVHSPFLSCSDGLQRKPGVGLGRDPQGLLIHVQWRACVDLEGGEAAAQIVQVQVKTENAVKSMILSPLPLSPDATSPPPSQHSLEQDPSPAWRRSRSLSSTRAL